jgi:hypothetical protein
VPDPDPVLPEVIEFCALAGDQPATACTPQVRSLIGRENSASPFQGVA